MSKATEEITIRRGQKTDVSQLKALVEACYGKNCSDSSLYSETETWEKICNKEVIIYVGLRHDGRVLGMEACEIKNPFKKTLLLKTMMTMPDFRNRGIGRKITDFIMKDFNFSPFASAYAFALTYNCASQKVFAENGFIPAGFLFNSYLGYGERRNTPKRSHVIMVKRFIQKCNIKLYVPKELRSFTKGVYHSFGVNTELKGEIKQPVELYSDIEYNTDTYHQNTEIIVKTTGQDLGSQVQSIKKNGSGMPLGTINLFLNTTDKGAVWGYECLKRQGFRFTGIKPFGNGEEYLVLHASEKVAVRLDTMILYSQSEGLREALKVFIKEEGHNGAFSENKE